MIGTERRIGLTLVTELLKQDRNRLLKEIVYHYMMHYGKSDSEARQSIGRDLRNCIDIEDDTKRLDRVGTSA